MAYAPIALTMPQYEDYANWYLKAYTQGTTTPLSMATDSGGGTTLAKSEIDANGFPTTDGSARFIPYINGAYDLWMFPTSAEADANDTSNAIQLADNINADPASAIIVTTVSYAANISALLAIDGTVESRVNISGYHTAGDGGGGKFYWDASQDKANHNGGTIIDPDVTFPADWTNATQVNTWFTAGAGTGCWVRLFEGNKLYASWFGYRSDSDLYDDYYPLQSAIDTAEALQSHDVIISAGTTDKIAGIGTRLQITSANHVRLGAENGYIEIKWIGSALTLASNDDATGAMVEFVGTDHAWSGLYGITLNGDGKAVHGVYVEGTLNTGFDMWTGVRVKGMLGDGWYMKYNGTKGPNGLLVDNAYAFPQQTLGNITCACGRSILHFHLNNSVGNVHVSNIVVDNGGTDGVIFWETETNARSDLIVTGAKAENWNSTGDTTASDADFIVTKHNVDAQVGSIILDGVKLSQSGDTAWNALVHNKSANTRRMIVNINPVRVNNAITYIYEEDNDSTKNIAYDLKYRDMPILINTSAHTGILPHGNGFATTPAPGSHYWDNASRKMYYHDGTNSHWDRVGFPLVEKRSAAPTITEADHGKTFTNGSSGGSIAVSLPDAATVGLGFTVSFYTDVAQTWAVSRAGSDVIDNGATSLTSSGAIGEFLSLRVMDTTGTPRWGTIAKIGTWT